MCGILAILGKAIDPERARAHSARMNHRGPDERDLKVTEMGVLCHERLSIIDLKTGKQPIQGTRNTWLIHNGEIYNHTNLHRELLQNKYACRTTSDSEVIVHLYEEFGPDMCNYLDGMFAFVVTDDDKKTFVAGRDPMGKKPLYWGRDEEGRYWFSSEMKSLADACVTFEAFPPGHFYSPETGLQRYYNPKWENGPATDEDPSGLRESLESAVEKRLMSDVPFGVLLSGGLDSSLISSIVARKLRGTGQELHSFSIGLNADAPDLKYARIVAEHIGSTHHEVYFSVEEGIEMMKKLVWHLESYDVTTLRASTPMYFLTRYIRQSGIKMVLSGEGADEIFGGYLYFFNAPDDAAFHEETKRRVRLLHTADVLRADKSTMANGIEVRVPMLDKAFLEKSMGLHPALRRPIRGVQMEKDVLRRAFDNGTEDPYLPPTILWRQKEQFSDGVGYNWIDSMKAFCEAQVSDAELEAATERFPYNTPATKEAYYIRTLFHEHFPQDSAAKTVLPWIPMWQANADPSGRANDVHQATTEQVDAEA
ncbi:MAG: asparagine synthase B [Bacteroidota bacterium]